MDLENAMAMLIKLYDHIQTYQEDKNLADYIADLTTASAMDISNTNIHYVNITNRLDVTIGSNLILHNYAAALNTFKQFVFPIADYYFKDLQFPSQLKINNNLDDLIYAAKKQIRHLIDKYEDFKTTVTKYDRCIMYGTFSNELNTTLSTMRGGKYEGIIFDLLSGKEVIVRLDVADSIAGFDAIKFSSIRLKVVTENIALRVKIQEKLKYFRVNMVHLGNSHYRFNGKIYRMDSGIVDLEYSYKQKSNGEPFEMNSSNRKRRMGELMLSPFALWKIKLHKNPHDQNSSTGLEYYAKEIAIQFEGEGSFIDVTKKHCADFNVDDYYKPVVIVNKGFSRTSSNFTMIYLNDVDENFYLDGGMKPNAESRGKDIGYLWFTLFLPVVSLSMYFILKRYHFMCGILEENETKTLYAEIE